MWHTPEAARARAAPSDAPVAQLDRAGGFYPSGCGFDSCRGHGCTVAGTWLEGRRRRLTHSHRAAGGSPDRPVRGPLRHRDPARVAGRPVGLDSARDRCPGGGQPEGRRGEDHHRALARGGLGRARPPHAGRRPRSAGVPDLLARLRPRCPRQLAARRVRPPAERGRGGAPRPGRPRAGRPAGHHRPGRLRGPPAHPDRTRARARPGARAGARLLRPGPHRLPSVARRAHHQRADRRPLRPDPAAVRGPLPPRRGPAPRDHRGRAGLRQRPS